MTVDALRLVGIHKSFDGFKALTDASFAARWGEVHALLGENGAGKSSLMNIAAGLYAPEQGELLVDDNPVRLAGPRAAAALHIGMVHQHFKLVRPFTVAENILLGHPLAQAEGSHRRRMAQLEQEIAARAAELGFAIDPRARLERLSIAEQQRVEILKVLLAGARILILDEPTAVLTDQEAERLLATVHALSRQGAAVALVTHKMSDVKTWADRVTVMRGGRTVATVAPKATPIEELVRLTVGQSVAASTAATEPAMGGAPLLTVRGLRLHANGRQALDGVDLTLHAGQIYGLAGVGGNGQGELAEALMGMAEGLEGTIALAGEGGAATGRLPHFAAIPADRYGLALAGGLSVVENFGIGQVQAGRYGPAWRLDRARMAADTREAVQAFDVQGVRHLNQKAALLSGGNAQKLVLAHSPSRGLDVRAGAEVHARLRAARDAGAAVLLISEDLDEVLALADRVGVMARGRIVAEFDQPADRQAVGQAMVNHD